MDNISDKREPSRHVEEEAAHGDSETLKGEANRLGATGEYLVVDEQISRRIVRKFDWRILLLATIINLFSFIDRVNIGNARLLGLEKDLDLAKGYRFNIALMCLLIPYCVVELPANIVCKKVGAHIWIPFLTFSFGSLTIFMGLLKNKEGLYALRFLLGVFEGGISPGLVYMLSMFYRRKELGFRISIYISASTASGAFGGLLAIGLSKIPQWGMIHTWRNIYIFEGLISVCLGIVSYFLLPSDPSTAKFLTEEEKVVAADRLRLDAEGTTETSHATLKHVIQALSSIPTLLCSFGFFLGATAIQSFSLFAPSIIAGMGYSNEKAQLLSVGPYASAAILSIAIGWISDRYKHRGIPIMCTVPFGIAGFFMLALVPANQPALKYGAMYLAAAGIYGFQPLWLAWAVNNSATPTVRAAASAIVFSVGGLGGIIAPWVYLPQGAPQYKNGHIILLSFIFAAWVVCALIMAFIRFENKARELGKRDHRLNGLTTEQELDLSSNHPSFRYLV